MVGFIQTLCIVYYTFCMGRYAIVSFLKVYKPKVNFSVTVSHLLNYLPKCEYVGTCRSSCFKWRTSSFRNNIDFLSFNGTTCVFLRIIILHSLLVSARQYCAGLILVVLTKLNFFSSVNRNQCVFSLTRIKFRR